MPGVERSSPLGSAIETEAKLGAWPGFELPPLDGALPGLRAEPGGETTLDATYYDAADLRLVRAGISLRHRLGEGGDAGRWTLKLADDADDATTVRRRELTVDGPAGRLPPELAGVVRPWLRTAALVPVARLQTRRRSTALLLDDERVASVDDDEVSVLQDGRVAARFREVEVELAGDPPDALLPAVVARLQEAGAGAPDPTSKLVRALGPRALQAPDLAVPSVGRRSTAGEVLRAGVASSVRRVVEHDAVIRIGDDDEGIHQARVGIRRLRSDLQTFAPLLETAWSAPLREELEWLGDALGAVRDRDVMAKRLTSFVRELPEKDRDAALAVVARLGRERDRAHAAAVAALDSRRYLALLDRLVEAATSPRLRPAADAPAVEVVPALAADAFGKLRGRIRRLGKAASDEKLHAARIQAKKARYAVDVAVPVVGARAAALAKALGGLQDVLGDHHDCAVAEAWLVDAARTATRPQAFALGQLAAGQRHEAARLRGRWRGAWEAVDKPKLTAWLEG